MKERNDLTRNLYPSLEILSLEMALSDINNVHKNVINSNKNIKDSIESQLTNSLKNKIENKRTSLISRRSSIDSKITENKEFDINNKSFLDNTTHFSYDETTDSPEKKIRFLSKLF